jgi:ABC-type sugar transport system ATPase subunit
MPSPDPFSDPFTGEESGRSIIELRGISRSFGSQEVLRNVSLDVRAGETVA